MYVHYAVITPQLLVNNTGNQFSGRTVILYVTGRRFDSYITYIQGCNAKAANFLCKEVVASSIPARSTIEQNKQLTPCGFTFKGWSMSSCSISRYITQWQSAALIRQSPGFDSLYTYIGAVVQPGQNICLSRRRSRVRVPLAPHYEIFHSDNNSYHLSHGSYYIIRTSF